MFSRKNVIAVKEAFRIKADAAKAEAESRKQELYRLYPEVEEFDKALAACYSKLISIVLDPSIDRDSPEVRKTIDQIRDDSLRIQQDRKKCLTHYGYPEDYTDPKYDCPKCSDTGYVGITMCSCLKTALIKESFASSGLGSLLETQTFENFSFDYYKYDGKAYDNIRSIYDYCRDYAGDFSLDRKMDNLILIGDTGLGKTHISTAIAKVVIEKGFDVLYRTAIDMFSDFENDRFNRRYNDTDEPQSDKYFTAELLIIDDLGTELTNQFTVSTLYNLINKRVIAGRPMIINTNLNVQKLKEKYENRVTSRILGEFKPLMFIGKDVRAQKIAKKYEN
ncbi:MAG: ATP-binding protein [Clostridia bacterium]|nr:ATP-binding protein [Clostridia bacterium]